MTHRKNSQKYPKKSASMIGNKNRKTHGMTGTSIFICWGMMRQRCQNPRQQSYLNYGGRGIKVCKRWDKFENFYKDMGDIPSPGYELDRIDNNDDYKPSNCQWATAKQQNRNRRNCIFIKIGRDSKCVSEWGEIYKIKPERIRARIRLGWNAVDAIKVPVLSKWKSDRRSYSLVKIHNKMHFKLTDSKPPKL